jgi:hypothetical protein
MPARVRLLAISASTARRRRTDVRVSVRTVEKGVRVMIIRVPVFYWYGDTDAEQARRLAICLRAAFEELFEDATVQWTETDQVTYEGDMEEWDFHAAYDEALDVALQWWEGWERGVAETGESGLKGDPYMERYRRARESWHKEHNSYLEALREAQRSRRLGKHITILKD